MARTKGLSKRYEDAKKRVRDYSEKVDEMIVEKPRESIMIAFGAGALVGAALVAALMGRKR